MEESFLMSGFYIKEHHYDEETRKAILEHTKKTKKKGETYKKKLVKDLVNKELGNGR